MANAPLHFSPRQLDIWNDQHCQLLDDNADNDTHMMLLREAPGFRYDLHANFLLRCVIHSFQVMFRLMGCIVLFPSFLLVCCLTIHVSKRMSPKRSVLILKITQTRSPSSDCSDCQQQCHPCMFPHVFTYITLVCIVCRVFFSGLIFNFVVTVTSK